MSNMPKYYRLLIKLVILQSVFLTTMFGISKASRAQKVDATPKFTIGRPEAYSFDNLYKFTNPGQLPDGFDSIPASTIAAEWRLTGPGGYLSYKVDGSGNTLVVTMHLEFDTKQANFSGGYLLNESLGGRSLRIYLPYLEDYPRAKVTIALDLDADSTNTFDPNYGGQKVDGTSGYHHLHMWGMNLDNPIAFSQDKSQEPQNAKKTVNAKVIADLVSQGYDLTPADKGKLKSIFRQNVRDKSGHVSKYQVIDIVDMLYLWDENNGGVIQTNPPQDRYRTNDGPFTNIYVDAGPHGPVKDKVDGKVVITVEYQLSEVIGSVDYRFVSWHENPQGRTDGFWPGEHATEAQQGNFLHSGVTIASGYDIGQHTEQEIHHLNLPPELEKKLTPYAARGSGQPFVGLPAYKYVSKKPVDIGSDIDTLNKAVFADYLKKVQSQYDAATTGRKFTQLPSDAQTAIFDLLYSLGNPVSSKTSLHSVWVALTQQQFQSAADQLKKNFSFASGRRRDEANLLQGAIDNGPLD